MTCFGCVVPELLGGGRKRDGISFEVRVFIKSVTSTNYFSLLGKEEDDLDILRSILSQLEYRYQVCLWDKKGVPFRTYTVCMSQKSTQLPGGSSMNEKILLMYLR